MVIKVILTSFPFDNRQAMPRVTVVKGDIQMIARAASVALFTFMLSAPTMAQAVKEEVALNNFVHEHAICAAYYGIASQCTANRGDAKSKELADKLLKIGANALGRATKYGDALKMSPKTHTARLAMATDQLMEDIEKSCNNISIILNKHGNACQFLMEKPEVALERFLAGRPLKD